MAQKLNLTPVEDEELDLQPLDLQPIEEENKEEPKKEKSLFQKIASSEPAQRFLKGFSDKDIEELRKKGITSVSAGPNSFDVNSGETEPSFLPKLGQAESYTGGFLNSLYEDFIRPLGTASGFLGSAMPGRAPVIRSNVAPIVEDIIPKTKPQLTLPPAGILPENTNKIDVLYPTARKQVSARFEGTPAGVKDNTIPEGLPNLKDVPNKAFEEAKVKAAKNSGLNVENLEAVISKAPEPITNAVKSLIEEESKSPSLWKSDYNQIAELSPDLWFRSNRAVHLARQYDAEWVPNFERAVKKLTNTEKKNFGQYVEGVAKSPSPNVDEAVNIWKQVENAVGDEASLHKLRLYSDDGSHIPFQKNTDNYWPRIPAEKLSEKTFIERLMQGGMTRSEAVKVVKNYTKTGELVISAQHGRSKFNNIPYRTDTDVAIQHIRSMSKRIAQHREFGPLDVKGRGSEGIAELIENTSDPTKALEIMQRIIGRDEKANANLTKWLDRSRKYAAWTKLQNFTIPNIILGQGPTTLFSNRLGTKNIVPSIKEVTKLFSSRYRDEIRKSGAVQNFSSSLAEELSLVDPYAIGAGETFNRYIAAAVGKATAKTAFEVLKKNPLDKVARKELEGLILDKVDGILSQNELTNNQLNMAAGRAGEITQGLNVPGNLPHWASNPVKGPMDFVGQLMWTFKKMGYQSTKSVWDSIKANPKVNVPLWLGLSQAGGELTGDVKAGLKGLWGGDPSDPILKRGDSWLEGAGITQSAIEGLANASGVPPEVIGRMLDNQAQYFMLGLPADLVQSAGYGPFGLLSAAAGPVITDISKFGSKIIKGDVKGLAKDAIKALPIPGSSGLADSLFDD